MKDCLFSRRCFLIFLIISTYSFAVHGQKGNDDNHIIDLSGKWKFQIDSLDKGIRESWFNRTLDDIVNLPGSMLTNGKGNEITADTKWTGGIWDSLWYQQPEYEPYRQPGNIKISFWLQPLKHYVGVAWYQKTVIIPKNWKNSYTELFLERCHWESTLWIDDVKVGMRNALGTPHIYDLSKFITPGEHRITIRMDNRIKDIDPGSDAHSLSDNTQTNWNGIVGEMTLRNRPAIFISNVKLFPDVAKKSVRTEITINNLTKKEKKYGLKLWATPKNFESISSPETMSRKIKVKKGRNVLSIDYGMGDDAKLWNEFNPNVYALNLLLSGKEGDDLYATDFGMRNIAVKGTRFRVNNEPVFFRGTLECAIFPKTGYPPVNVQDWKNIYLKCKEYGLNHIRFHSWCPPEAAFIAADDEGMYLSVECSAWANVGDGAPIDKYIYEESERIVKQFGNHPSFCMMPYGNEAHGKDDVAYLTGFVNYWKEKDNRRLYTSAAGFPESDASEYASIPQPRIQWWAAGLKSPINANPPTTAYDWTKYIKKDKPTISHEIGQWCVYPDFTEIPEYDGVLKAKNFEIFQDFLSAHGMENLSRDFLMASGKLQVLCYKADIEAALRTPGFAGFQLLSLQDFPGQGTALVGVLNPFWKEKGYVSAREYRRFCNTVVPLIRMEKMIYENDEEIVDTIKIANFSGHDLDEAVKWKVEDANGKEIWQGEFAKTTIPQGNEFFAGEIKQPLSLIKAPGRFTIKVSVGEYENDWDFFVYPAVKKKIDSSIYITPVIDQKAEQLLAAGGKVLLTPKKGSLKQNKGGDIQIGFSSIFWNTAWTNGQPPTTLGILCDPNNPALAEFPTQYHSNYQWWDAMSHSNAILLDSVGKNLQPIVRVIDDWFKARPLGLIFECKTGPGKLIVAGIDLLTDNENRPEAKQMLQSLGLYMMSNKFNPSYPVSIEKIKNLFNF